MFACIFKTCFATALVLSAATASATSAVTFDLMNTVQDCNHEGHRSTWCTGDDTKASTAKSGIVARLIEQINRTLENPSKSRVIAAEFSFSNRDVQGKLCEAGRAGVAITVYLDYSQNPNIDLDKCQKDLSKPNYKILFLGGFTNFPDWRLHHNKTILVDAGDGSNYDIDFASGNLSVFGASLHLENWVMMSAQPKANISRSTLCLFDGLAAADKKSQELAVYDDFDFSKDPEIIETFQTALGTCYARNKVIPMERIEESLAAEGIAPIFTPNTGALGSKTILNEINKVGVMGPGAYIYIAMENFTQRRVFTALQKAAEAGVDVRLVMNAGTVTGATEVGANVTFYEENLRNSDIKIRFIETNPDAGGNGQQMHNKFTILNGARVFSGAGHFTRAGLETNYETLYLTSDDSLNREYLVYFKKLWDASVDEDAMRSGLVNEATEPETLNSRALEVIAE